MGSSVISEIEESILALPEKEQLRLISRVTQTLRRRPREDLDSQLAGMANDPQIQRELMEIERDFSAAEIDCLSE